MAQSTKALFWVRVGTAKTNDSESGEDRNRERERERSGPLQFVVFLKEDYDARILLLLPLSFYCTVLNIARAEKERLSWRRTVRYEISAKPSCSSCYPRRLAGQTNLDLADWQEVHKPDHASSFIREH